jgi:flagellar biosynthesis protein FliQ
MSAALFGALFMTGAALLAVWFDMRFPGVRPASWLRLGIAVGVAMALDDVCTASLDVAPRLVAVIGVALPAIALTFLVSIWMLRMLRSQMPG